jgi:serine/threonine protein kinase
MAHPAGPARKKPVLLVAAESIALTAGFGETVADVLRARALSHYSEALRQYLTIRLQSSAAAQDALLELRQQLDDWTAERFAQHPGPRAHLFKLARGVARNLRTEAAGASANVPWMTPQNRSLAEYAEDLMRVRRELSNEQAELLELRYARELSPEEIAYVVDRSIEDVVTALEKAAAGATAILGEHPPSRLGGLRGALQEAFALSADGAVRDRAESTDPDALPVNTLIGDRYALQQRVGEGSFGDVYRALDMDVPGHVVALKLLHRSATCEEARKAALRELRLLASVFHPSVVNFKDHGWYRDRLWFVMPWYEGETLEERIEREPLSRAEAQEIFVPLAQALATMHAAGIRHQDVKPDNIFLARIGEAGTTSVRVLPVLIDLGVAAKEAEMIVAGTPLYFAPEIAAQYAGKAERPPITTKADVFSLALSLRNALEPDTQEHVPGTAVESFIGFRADHPPKPPEARELRFLESHFRRWLSRDASQRPSAWEFAEELAVLTRPEMRRDKRRAVLRWASPIAACAMAGIVSISYVYLRERDAAHAARLRADETQNRLGVVSAESAELRESYAHSELTRQELSNALADSVGEARSLASQLARARREADVAATKLLTLAGEADAEKRKTAEAQQELAAMSMRVARLEGDLFSSQQRQALADSELREARSRLASAAQELDSLRVRARDVLSELDRARADARGQGERVGTLEGQLQEMQRERSRMQRELVDERERSAAFSQQAQRAPQDEESGSAQQNEAL